MAKRKSKKGNAVVAQAPSGPERKSVETEECENGYIVRLTHEGKQGYSSKRYVASSLPEAQRIAGHGMSALSKKGDKRKAAKHKTFGLRKG